MDEGLQTTRAEALAALASCLDGLASAIPVCPADDDRGRLYHRAAATPAAHDPLHAALSLETDESLVAEVVIGALEHAPASALADWLGLVADTSPRYEYVKRRADEAALLLDLTAPAAEPPTTQALDSWSDWLQRRVAARASSAALLAQLADSGRTRRIRNTARSRLPSARTDGVAPAHLDPGMSRDEADALAKVVSAATRHDVRVVSDEGFFGLEVHVGSGGDPGTYFLRDEEDWSWLSERIGRRS